MKVLLIYKIKNAMKIEKCVIAQIKELRYKKRKDFYEMDLKLLKSIIKDCDELTLKYKKRINKNIINTNQIGGEENDKLYLYIKKKIQCGTSSDVNNPSLIFHL